MTELQDNQNDIVLSVRNVGLSYSLRKGPLLRKKFWALKDVSFDLYRGDCLGVVGRNGAGKSSLLKLLANVISPDYGHVINCGCTTSLLSMQLGFLPHLTGRENALLGGMFQGMTKREVLDKMDEIIEFSELGSFIDEQLTTYSTGMAARLGFAVAFQVQPDVLLVDEIIGVGDASFQQRSMAVMKARLRAEDTTIVFVSHNPSSIREMCNRVVWIEDHVVQCVGPADEVLAAYSHYTATGEFLPMEKLGRGDLSDSSAAPPEKESSELVRIDFTSPDSAKHLSDGWSAEAKTGRWSTQEKVSFTFTLNRPIRHPKIRIFVEAYGGQKVIFTLNNRYPLLLGLNRNPQERELEFPADRFQENNEIVIQLPDRQSPASVGAGTDTRELGVQISWVEVEN